MRIYLTPRGADSFCSIDPEQVVFTVNSLFYFTVCVFPLITVPDINCSSVFRGFLDEVSVGFSTLSSYTS